MLALAGVPPLNGFGVKLFSLVPASTLDRSSNGVHGLHCRHSQQCTLAWLLRLDHEKDVLEDGPDMRKVKEQR